MKSNIALACVLIVLGALSAWANGDAHDLSVDEILDEIRAELGIGSRQEIDPEAVSDPLLERLGEAVMNEHAGSDRAHERMDRMMGGEGSESLASAHRWMGYRYLTGGYGTGTDGMMRSGMMGSGMMGSGTMGGSRGSWGMMGNPDISYEDNPYMTPEEIVRRRYAEGEIDREQYREMLDELRQ